MRLQRLLQPYRSHEPRERMRGEELAHAAAQEDEAQEEAQCVGEAFHPLPPK